MIGKLCISYNPDQHTYNSIREKFSLSKNNPSKKFDDNPITEISTLDLYYEQWGHVCFFDTTIDMNLLFRNQKVSLTPMDELDYKKFRILLAKAYIETLGKEIAEKINILEQFNCTYVEYISFLKVSHPDEIMCQLKQSKFKKEQLDINCFESYKLKNAYISFTVNQIDRNTIRLCAKCPNTVLKRIFKIQGLAHIKVEQALNREIAADILFKQVAKYTKPNIPDEFSKEHILIGL